MRLTISIATSLALGSITLLTSCGKGRAPQSGAPKESAPREVRVARTTFRPMERTLQVVGTLAAQNEATVAAQVAGQLEKNLVDLGDRVQAGQELALIDTTSYTALASASAANLTRANASAANAAQNLKRAEDLQRENIASTSDLEAAVAEAARTRAEVKAAEANDAVARLAVDRSRVKAPFTGIIAERLASPGDYLAIGTPIVRLVQTDPLRLRLEVPERDAVVVRVGQNVRILLEGDTNNYSGQLNRIAPAIRADNRMLPVEADVPNPGGLRAGLFVRAQIVITAPKETLSVPTKAIVTFAGLEKVVAIKDGKAAEKTVTTGRRDSDWVEILSGLDTGETIILDPAGIRTGQSVVVANQSSNPKTAQTNAAR
ncbi:MAG: efflux RND transporter periplasmic adaptor subunit [Verrucomicrobiota bacterium]